MSNAIWDKPGPVTQAESERIRLHPYLTERMLARVGALGRSREIAARHHERLDGSGYPRGLTAATLTPPDRLLAAADVYHAMTEPRPHRAPLDPGQASRELRAEVAGGRLDSESAEAVLAAAGHRVPARRVWPGGLTAREVEVLALLARGHSTREIAQALVVTPKTAANHIEHIYTKLGVSSRAAATLYATQHGLMGTFEPAGCRTQALKPGLAAVPAGATQGHERVPPPSCASRDRTDAGTAALPTMAGLPNLGTFGSVMCSARVTVKPACWMESSVGRLQSQPTTNRLIPFMRSCERARSVSPERTCSMNRSWPPGRSTRLSSRSARGWSSTPHSTSVETATSKVASSKGRSSAGARSTVAPGACSPALRSRRRSIGVSGSVRVSDWTAGP